MIETKKQAVAALIYIQQETGWSYRDIAKRANCCYSTLSRLASDNQITARKPNAKLRENLYDVYRQVKSKEFI
jgi:hypothetical protein